MVQVNDVLLYIGKSSRCWELWNPDALLLDLVILEELPQLIHGYMGIRELPLEYGNTLFEGLTSLLLECLVWFEILCLLCGEPVLKNRFPLKSSNIGDHHLMLNRSVDVLWSHQLLTILLNECWWFIDELGNILVAHEGLGIIARVLSPEAKVPNDLHELTFWILHKDNNKKEQRRNKKEL